MNKKNEQLYVFHIYRSSGEPMFLHPFEDPSVLLNLSDSTVIEGRYGREPRVESLTMFRNMLYRLIETAVKDWILDVKFIPRFLVSAGVFLFVYLFASFVIRDPLPMIDETIASFIGAGIVYYALARRNQSSQKAASKRLKLRICVDRIVFNESSFVKRFEDILHENETSDIEEQIKAAFSSEDNSLSESEKEEAAALLRYLDRIFSGKVYKKHENRIARFVKGGLKDDSKQLEKWIRTNGIDMPLYAAYRKIRITSRPD